MKAIEAKDTYTQGHSYRVVNIATKIGLEYNLSREDMDLLKYSSVKEIMAIEEKYGVKVARSKIIKGKIGGIFICVCSGVAFSL